jgi:hypothetical protein
VAPTCPSYSPRARDGPAYTGAVKYLLMYSPRARGWTGSAPLVGCPAYVFPACAGMDRVCQSADARLAGIPRVRGDGPLGSYFNELCEKYSPRARGWTGLRRIRFRDCDVFPACAGMDLVQNAPIAASAGIPRVRGDGPCVVDCPDDVPLYSPRARGWTDVGVSKRGGEAVFPACAGMDRCTCARSPHSLSIPRVRGDGPLSVWTQTSSVRYSPRARGWTGSQARITSASRVFPACAGMDRQSSQSRLWVDRVSRVRGDGPSWGD